MRVERGLPSLRQLRVSSVIGKAIRAGKQRKGFRVVQFSIQSDHLHFLVEGAGRRTLANGIRALAIRIARAANMALGRKGRLFSDRYHARALTTPKATRIALVYVLANFKHHMRDTDAIDPHSSGRWFGGWEQPPPPQATASPVAEARTWLARSGWKRYGKIGLHERPN
jgi:hypothetical protein